MELIIAIILLFILGVGKACDGASYSDLEKEYKRRNDYFNKYRDWGVEKSLRSFIQNPENWPFVENELKETFQNYPVLYSWLDYKLCLAAEDDIILALDIMLTNRGKVRSSSICRAKLTTGTECEVKRLYNLVQWMQKTLEEQGVHLTPGYRCLGYLRPEARGKKVLAKADYAWNHVDGMYIWMESTEGISGNGILVEGFSPHLFDYTFQRKGYTVNTIPTPYFKK